MKKLNNKRTEPIVTHFNLLRPFTHLIYPRKDQSLSNMFSPHIVCYYEARFGKYSYVIYIVNIVIMYVVTTA